MIYSVMMENHGQQFNNIWLAVSTYPSEKWWTSSVGMMIIPNSMENIQAMFQTTNQWCLKSQKMSFCISKII